MDDPISSHSMLCNDEEIRKRKNETFSLRYHNVNSIDDRIALRNKCVKNLLQDPWQVNYYVGWRKNVRQARQKIKRLLGAHQ